MENKMENNRKLEDKVFKQIRLTVRLKRLKISSSGNTTKRNVRQEVLEGPERAKGINAQFRQKAINQEAKRNAASNSNPHNLRKRSKINYANSRQPASDKMQSKIQSKVTTEIQDKPVEKVFPCRNLSASDIENILNDEMESNADNNDYHIKSNVQKVQKFFLRNPPPALDDNANEKSANTTYDFCLQPASDVKKQIDPTSDIIKRLISEGKAVVGNKRKWAKKPTLKRKPKLPARQPNKRKEPIELIDTSQQGKDLHANRPIASASRTPVLQEQPYLGDCSEDYLDDCPVIGENCIDDNLPIIRAQVAGSNNGTYSRLARSVLLNGNDTDIHLKKVREQHRLLEIARNFVSTPIRQTDMSTSPIHVAALSPIYPTADITTQPWRLKTDAPSVFHFNCNSANLPSFSSEYIPSTPKKQHSFRRSKGCGSIPQSPTGVNPITIHAQETTESAGTESSSLNHSNKENITPPRVSVETAPLGFQRLTRTATSSRTVNPLNSIKILDVITLHPWKKPHEDDRVAQDQDNECDDLFGFVEFLEADNINESESVCPAAEQKETSTLHSKLQDLKKLRPRTDELPGFNPMSISNVYATRTRKQQSIKDMFCSTMIAAKPSNQLKSRDLITSKEEEHLFNDIEPDTTFDERKSRRTYIRPYKKKRKVCHNFVMFTDSEESGEELEAKSPEINQDNARNKKHRKVESKEAKPNPEMNAFVNEFNSMCNEVEQYDLLIEKTS